MLLIKADWREMFHAMLFSPDYWLWLLGEIFEGLLSLPGDDACGSCGGDPGTAGGGVCQPAERHPPAGAAAVAVAELDPRPDRHSGGHAAAAAAGHTTAGTHTYIQKHTRDH